MTRFCQEGASQQRRFSLRSLYLKGRCSGCRTPRHSDGIYCFNCGLSLRRKAPYFVLSILLLAGLVFSLSDSEPVATVASSGLDPHRRIFERPRKLPLPMGSPAAVLARVEDLLAREAGGRAHVLAAVDLLNELIEKYPDYDYARRLNGNLLAQVQRHQSAATALSAYLENQPADMNARITLVRQLMALERWDEAVAQLDQVAAAHPHYALVEELTAQIHGGRGEREKAAISRQRALAMKQAYGIEKPPIVYLPRLPE